jgi:hypothetical protein
MPRARPDTTITPASARPAASRWAIRVPKEEALRAPTTATQGRELFLMTQSPKEWRGVGDFRQQAGVAWFVFKNEIRANFLAGEIFALRHMRATQLIRFDPFTSGQIGQGSQGFDRRAMGRH